MENGSFVISLDFELYWGVRDKRTLGDCRERMKGVHSAIPRVLSLFEDYDVHATWATVGFLFFSDAEELLRKAPLLKPSYIDQSLCPYSYVKLTGAKEEELHFAPYLIDKIVSTKGQEIGTHTLSHYYCLEEGQTVEEFRADLSTGMDLAKARGLDLRTLVFPRNQSDDAYIRAFADLGGQAYRGNEFSPLYRASATSGHNLAKRAGRLLDAYVNLSGSNTYKLEDPAPGECLNIPSSRFLRPYSKRLALFDGLKLKRIKDAMSYAAENNEIFHLWWHPHNFGVDTDENLRFLERVLSHYALLRENQGMTSMSMGEVANMVMK
jgi:peptidoglycan/xylan/chitin deacetylase (PgdA/CDA1 family)